MKYNDLTNKKQQLDGFRPLPPGLACNLDDWFKVELTYNSNAIEGNTLTRHETAVVIEKGLTVGGKSIKEHLEATNHAHALDLINSLIKRDLSQLTCSDILGIHNIILKNIDDNNAGRYRNVSVRISGSRVIMPNLHKVPQLMDEFQDWLTNNHDLHPVAFAGEAHYRLVTIHPFIDGNGRTARLLMNLLLLICGYPPAIIRKNDKLTYINALEKAQLGGSKLDYDRIIYKAVDRSLNLYLKAVQGKTAISEANFDNLMKIGELAKVVEETVPTIRFWTKEGLLSVVEVTKSGYQLYNHDMIKLCKLIKKLKSQRLTLLEIKGKIQI